jgi:hypothetical protein
MADFGAVQQHGHQGELWHDYEVFVGEWIGVSVAGNSTWIQADIPGSGKRRRQPVAIRFFAPI